MLIFVSICSSSMALTFHILSQQTETTLNDVLLASNQPPTHPEVYVSDPLHHPVTCPHYQVMILWLTLSAPRLQCLWAHNNNNNNNNNKSSVVQWKHCADPSGSAGFYYCCCCYFIQVSLVEGGTPFAGEACKQHKYKHDKQDKTWLTNDMTENRGASCRLEGLRPFVGMLTLLITRLCWILDSD